MNPIIQKPYIVMGAGGHGAVVADILYRRGYTVRGFLDDGVAVGTEVLRAKVLGKIESCTQYPDAVFIIAVGLNSTRKRIAEAYPVEYGSAIHPSVIIGAQARIGRGSVLMAGSIVNPRTIIGEHCIINTKASLDHDNMLADFVHISPAAVTGGDVSIGECTHIGIGAVIKNGISICGNVTIGAGATVVKNIVSTDTYIGTPASPVGARRP